jgi:hypothetical protein
MDRIATAASTAGRGAFLGLLLGLPLGLLAPVLPAHADVVVSISKSQQRLAVTVDGTELHRWPVSTGRRGLETPSGAFRPIRLERTWYSRKYDRSPMPYSIFFHRGYAVHGSYERRHLGRAVSHGCVRLLPAHAATLFSLVRRQGKGNARIVVMNGPLPSSTNPTALVEAHKPTPSPKHETVATAVTRAAEPVAAVPRPRHVKPRAVAPRVVRVRSNNNFVTAGDEAAVLRGRQAWLRSLDRKYGIAH